MFVIKLKYIVTLLHYISLRATCLAIFSYFDYKKGFIELQFVTHACTITNQISENCSQTNTMPKYYLHYYIIIAL